MRRKGGAVKIMVIFASNELFATRRSELKPSQVKSSQPHRP